MITENTQVRLTVELRGRLASTGANSNSKKEHHLAFILNRKGKSFHNEYVEPTYHKCTQSVTLSSDAVHYFASEDGKLAKIPLSTWKKMSPTQKLEANLQQYADYLSEQIGTPFTYSLIN